jgi:hypothetical protein
MVEFDCGNQPLTDDVTIQYYHRNVGIVRAPLHFIPTDIYSYHFLRPISRPCVQPMFSFSFHTGFIRGNWLKLLKRDIDGAHTDKLSKHFHKDFRVELSFSEIGVRTTLAMEWTFRDILCSLRRRRTWISSC